MANLMSSSTSQVIRWSSSPRNRGGKNRATIEKQTATSLSLGEVAIPKKTISKVLEVHVECLVVALAKSFLHGGFVGIIVPAGVRGTGRSKEVEGNTGGSIVLV